MNEILKPFDDTKPDYIPDNRPKICLEKKEKHPLGVYNANGCLLGFTWNYGDDISLIFLDFSDLIASYIIPGKTIDDYNYIFNIYSQRGELLKSISLQADTDFRLPIKPLDLKPNIYCMEIKLSSKEIHESGYESGESGIVYPSIVNTLIPQGKYNLYVK